MLSMKNARRSEAGVIQKAGGLFTTYDNRTSCKLQLLAGPRFQRQIVHVRREEHIALQEGLIDGFRQRRLRVMNRPSAPFGARSGMQRSADIQPRTSAMRR